MTCIMGVDPGSRITGYGLIRLQGSRSQLVDCGCVRLDPKAPLPQRLNTIFAELGDVIDRHHPAHMAVEQVFMHRNADSALKLGQARGAAILAGTVAGLDIAEYAPRAIKLAVVGSGGADKTQVQHMVKMLLNLHQTLQADAADALAVALTHGHTLQTQQRLQRAGACP